MKVTATGTVAEPPAVTAICTRAFAGCPESVSAARAWVAGFLPGSPAADDVALLTSELFTNAVLYSASGLPGGLVTVSVRTGDGSVRVDVIDQGDLPPGLAPSRGLGAGLVIVCELADVFGAEGPDRWFSLRTGGRVVTRTGQRIAALEREVVEFSRDGSPDDEPGERCPRCGAASWGQTPDGRLECTRCLWSEPTS